MKYASALKLKLIYVFRINDSLHTDCLKIGETTSDNDNIWGLKPNSQLLNKAANNRIRQYTQTAGIEYELIYTELCVYSKKGTIYSFTDAEVHNVLLRSGILKKQFDSKNKANEWFITDLDTVKKAITAVKEGRNSLSQTDITNDRSPIIFRPEQLEAIKKTQKQFKKSNEMLWFAKMRFGKTLSALQVVKEMKFKRTIILTHRPVVNEGWFEDFSKIFYDNPEYYKYGSKNKGERFETLEEKSKEGNINYIYFVSMQDLRGSELVGGNFDKNNELFKTDWDFIIIDEAHEGTQTELGHNVKKELLKENTKVLHLSGTPFNLIDDYKEEEIYTWDYVMEQKAKAEWDSVNFGDPNPYRSLPRLNIYTYDLGNILKEFADKEVAFNFREFFRVNDEGVFIHNKDVFSFLNIICKEDDKTNYPFSTKEYRDNFRHSLWMVPGVKEALALSTMLQSHPIFHHFKIVNVAGDGDEDVEKENHDALQHVKKAIGENPQETYTITLSCGRLTTGVSVPAWTAVFMLSGSFNTSASSYMQTIFRVQTPDTINGKIKEECFVFDFAPDRTLKVVAEAAKISSKAGKTSGDDRTIMGEFLNFCPIIAFDGTIMREYNVNGMLEQLKKVYIERVVKNGFEDSYLYNQDLLMRMDELDITEFDKLKKIIGATKAMPKTVDIEINKQGFTYEEYAKLEEAEKKKRDKRELSEEERKLLEEKKEKRELRDTAISILRGISIRMPLLIYGANIENEEKELNINNFVELVDDQSWDEFMPKGVTKTDFNKFKKYYEEDVFRAAGKRIRAMAKAADNSPVEERIERITSIFNTFRNPDKETVLTPWRVVNMHLGDCLGGYVFFDEKYENTIEKPRFIDQGEVTKKVFDPNSYILEINSKSGLYPLFLTYSIYRNLLSSDNEYLTVEQEQKIWDKVITENVFVICKTPMAKAITQRTLVGFRSAKVNTRYFEDLINQIINKKEKFVEQIRKGKSYWKSNNNNNMKFNAIVGNPPYQLNDGSGASDDAANPIYQNFVRISKEINPNFLSLIMPSKWMVGGKIVLKSFRKEMMEDNHLSKIFDYEDSVECFKGQNIDGGICYFLWEKQKKDKLEYSYKPSNEKQFTKYRTLKDGNTDIIIRDYRRKSIIEKLKDEKSFSEIVSLTRPFGIRKDLFNSPERYPDSNLKFEPNSESLKIYGVKGIKGGAKRIVGYISRNTVTKNTEFINKYKLFFTTSYSTNAIKPPECIIGEINSVCTETFLLIGPFETQEHQLNCYKFIQTNLFNLMLFFGRGTMQVSKNVFQFIPLQNFTQTSDIDWSKSIDNINSQLLKKYKLTEEEIELIDSIIKPIN